MIPALWLYAAAWAAQVALDLDTREVREGETVGLTLTVTDATARGVPRLAAPDGLQVSFESQAQQHVVINLQASSSTRYRYALTALRAGTYTLGPYAIDTQAGSLQTAPVSLVVGARGAAGSLDTLDMEVAGDVVWVGQVVVAHLRYATERSLVSGRWSPPEGEGFMPEPGVQPLTAEYPVVQDGKERAVQELWMPLRATRAGRQTLRGGVLQAQFAVTRSRRNRDFNSIFQDIPGFADVRTDTVAAAPRELEVRSLPEAGRPADFTGLVGHFTLAASASAATVEAGGTVTVTIELQGDGPLAGAKLPPLAADGFRVYDDQPAVDAQIADGRYVAKATFKRAIVPASPGELTIPPTTLSWFDPTTGDYAHAATEPITLRVTGSAAAPAAVSSFAGEAAHVVDRLGEDILPSRTDVALRAPVPRAWALALLAPGALLLLGELRPRLRRRAVAAEARFTWADLPDDPEARLGGLERLFREAVARRLGVDVVGLRREDAARLGPEAEALYRELESLRYGGARGQLPEARVRAFVEGA